MQGHLTDFSALVNTLRFAAAADHSENKRDMIIGGFKKE